LDRFTLPGGKQMIGAVGDVLSTMQRSTVEFAPGDDDDDDDDE